MTRVNLDWSGEAAEGVPRKSEPWELALVEWADSYSGEEMRAFEAGFKAATKAQGGGWKPFFFGDSTPIREGQSYLFAAGSATAGWSYFHDALVWDAETYAQWREGDHGFATEDVKFYWELPAPPEAT